MRTNSPRVHCSLWIVLFLIGPLAPHLHAVQVKLASSPSSPQPVGTNIDWTAAGSDSTPGVITYRFSVAMSGGPFSIVRDYSQSNTFQWNPSSSEGAYQIQVTARNNSTQATAQQTASFQVTSRVSHGSPTVSTTANPLVALFSAPACPVGSSMQVRFQQLSSSTSDVTSQKACNSSTSMNFYVAGMRALSTYSMHSETITGPAIISGPKLGFTTGSPGRSVPRTSVIRPLTPLDSTSEHVILAAQLATVASPIAVDFSGNLLWYYAAPGSTVTPLLTRPIPGGTFLLIMNGANSSDAATKKQILREIDLAGNTVRETNASRIREQLIALGLNSPCQAGSSLCLFNAFHHEAVRLPNGHTLALGGEEQIFPAGTQGSTSPVDVAGAMVVDLDENFQVTWYWSAYDHLDVNRAAILGEKLSLSCSGSQIAGDAGVQASCVVSGLPLYLATVANDWLHANSIYYIPSDGNLLVSLRHQDWVIKIDYANGTGTGDIVWRLGQDGNFTISSTDPYPWFTHQHDVGYELGGTQFLSLFDNGNTRRTVLPGANSRGQVLNIDETNLVVTLALNANLGVYSFALGSAQRLLNGNYEFLAGWLGVSAVTNQSIEVLPDGTLDYTLKMGGPNYRTFRMLNLYTPPEK